MEENILNNIDMTQGVTPEGTQVNNAPMADLTDIIKTRFQNGEPALDILVDLIMQGIEPNQMGMAFEEIGFDPASYTQLLQDAEIKLQGMQQQAQAQQQMQQQQMPEQGNQQLPPVSEEELLAESEKAAREIESKDIQPMQYGGGTNRGLGPFLGSKDPVPRPLYLPPLPAQGNILGAAYMLDDAAGQLFSNKDRDGDGLMDGTFKDWSAKRARYKDKQLQNRTYEIDYGDLNPDDYSPTYQNLADLTETKFSKFFKGKKERERINQVQNTGLQTKEEFAENVFKNSLINFNPETGQYAAAFATRPEDYAMLGKKQKEEFGLLGPKKERKWSDPSSWFGREDAPLDGRYTLKRFTENLLNQDDIDLQMIKEARQYGPGRGLNKNRSSYDESLMTPSQIEQSRNTYRDIMLGKQSMNSEQPFIDFNQAQGFNATPKRSIVQIPEDQNSVNALDRETAFKEWALQDPATRMTTAGRKEFDRLNPMRYGGGLRKAQYGLNDYNPNNPFALPDFSQMGQTSYINPDTGMPYEPGPDAPIVVNENNPIELDEVTVTAPGTGGLKAKGLEPFVVDTPQMDLAPIDLTPPTQPSANENVERPTVKRKRTIGNAIKQAETFIKEDPAMRAYGDVSDFVVKGANLANEFFQQREFNDYKNKLRNLTNADKVYLASEDPVNKRGTFDVNLGLAEPDNLVDYYAQAMYGREMYKKGGEFDLPKAQNGLTDFLNSVNSALGGSDTYWNDGWVDGKEGWIPDELTGNKPTRRQLETASAALTSPKNWAYDSKGYSVLPNYNQYNTKDEAFAAARNDLGRGASFLYGDTRYTTNYEGEAPNNETQAVLDYVTEGLSAEQKERFMEVYKKAGQPPVSFEKDTAKYSIPVYGVSSWTDVASGRNKSRPHVNLLDRNNSVYINKRSNIEDTRNLLLDELSHNMQIRKDGTGASLWRFGTDAASGWLNDYDPYHKEGAFEHEAHEKIQPLLLEYVNQGGTFPDLDFANGGEFEPHMMYDPETGKGYKAKVPADHERMAKMGYLHKDEMQNGGELEVDNDTLAALIAAGADIEML